MITREVLPSGDIMYVNSRTRSCIVMSRQEEKELRELMVLLGLKFTIHFGKESS